MKGRKQKKYTKAQIAEMKLLKSLRFKNGSKSTFWMPGKADEGDYVPSVSAGELSRRR